MFFNTTNTNFYTPLWNKYRPAILQLMVASAEQPQEYKLSSHEFKAMNPKEKAYSFTLHASRGKAINNIRSSAVAQDLLMILEQSRKASELMEKDTYEFTLDKQFVLRIVKREAVEAKTE